MKSISNLILGFAVSGLTLFAGVSEAKNCGPTSQACGNTCIAKDAVCRVKSNSAQAPAATDSAMPAGAPAVPSGPGGSGTSTTPPPAGSSPSTANADPTMVPAAAKSAKACKTGKACGNTCIAQSAVCKIK